MWVPKAGDAAFAACSEGGSQSRTEHRPLRARCRALALDMLLSKPFKGADGLWERAEDVRQLLLDAGAPSGAKHVPKAKGKAMPQLEPLVLAEGHCVDQLAELPTADMARYDADGHGLLHRCGLTRSASMGP